MKRVYKYRIEIAGVFTINLPVGAEILHLGVQPLLESDSRYQIPYLWALVDPLVSTEDRIFHIYGTGHDVPHPELLNHVGTWQQGAFVWHMFEKILS